LNGQEVLITACFGIAGFERGEKPTLQELFLRADRALYSAKALGRNHVTMEVPTRPLEPMWPSVRS
jgi:GGDEF domain-containing protein